VVAAGNAEVAPASCWVAGRPRHCCGRSTPVGFDVKVCWRLILLSFICYWGTKAQFFLLSFDISFPHQFL
jgi:hypothetical protein